MRQAPRGAFPDPRRGALDASQGENRLGTKDSDVVRTPPQPSRACPGPLPPKQPPFPFLPRPGPLPTASFCDSCSLSPPRGKEPVRFSKSGWVGRDYFRQMRNNLLLHLINLNWCCAERKKWKGKSPAYRSGLPGVFLASTPSPWGPGLTVCPAPAP